LEIISHPLRLLGQWHVREVAHGVQPARRVSLKRGEQRCEVALRRTFHGDEFERLAARRRPVPSCDVPYLPTIL
jgi:hypothetical protein